jgi:hypothetical protein
MGLIYLAIFLAIFLFPTGFIYMLIFGKDTAKTKRKIAIAIDQMGAVVCGDLFNDYLLIKDTQFNFKNEDRTISTTLKMAKEKGELTRLGIMLYNAINTADEGHFNNLKPTD